MRIFWAALLSTFPFLLDWTMYLYFRAMVNHLFQLSLRTCWNLLPRSWCFTGLWTLLRFLLFYAERIWTSGPFHFPSWLNGCRCTGDRFQFRQCCMKGSFFILKQNCKDRYKLMVFQAYRSFYFEGSITWRFKDHDWTIDMDNRGGGYAAKFHAQWMRLGSYYVSMLVVGPWISSVEMYQRRRNELPMTLVKHSSPGKASRWLHFRRSKFFARSTAGCCSLPCRYNSCMQHCVITKERLCHLSNQRFIPSCQRMWERPTWFNLSLKNRIELFS